MEIFLFVLLILLIIVFSALASGSEAALLSVSYPKIKELANSKKKSKKKAQKLLYIKDNIQRYITTIVVFNNIVNIIGSIYVGVLASNIFGDLYLGLISGVLTFLIIIFAEIIPKVFAEQHSKKISLIITPYIIFFTKLFSPIIFVLDNITKYFVKENNQKSISEGEIKEMAAMSHEEGSINSYESEIIKNVFEMNDIDVYDIMVPKSETTLIQKDATYEDIVKIVDLTGHTRFPVMDKDEIIGIVNAKDLFKYYGNEERFFLSKVLRLVIYAPENMKLSTLEAKLKKERTHMAIIVNEFGDFVGIVTLEDIIEEIIGDIEDEFDHLEKNKIEQIDENKYQIEASYDINDLNEEFNLGLEVADEEFHTINGYFTHKLGRISKINDKIRLKKASLRVIKASKK